MFLKKCANNPHSSFYFLSIFSLSLLDFGGAVLPCCCALQAAVTQPHAPPHKPKPFFRVIFHASSSSCCIVEDGKRKVLDRLSPFKMPLRSPSSPANTSWSLLTSSSSPSRSCLFWRALILARVSRSSS